MELKRKWLKLHKEIRNAHFEMENNVDHFQRMRLNKDERVRRRGIKGK